MKPQPKAAALAGIVAIVIADDTAGTLAFMSGHGYTCAHGCRPVAHDLVDCHVRVDGQRSHCTDVPSSKRQRRSETENFDIT